MAGRVPGIDRAAVNDDAVVDPPSARGVGDMGNEGRAFEETKEPRGRPITEQGPRPAGEDRREPALVRAVRRRMKGVDTTMDSEETPGLGPVLDAVRAETDGPQLLLAKQVLLIGSELRDRSIALVAIGLL